MSNPLTMEALLRLDQEREAVVPAALAIKPTAPDNITVTAGKRGFRIQWSQVIGVDGYRIAVISDQDLTEPDLVIERSGNTTLEYFYYVGNVAITRFFAVQSFSADESSEFTEIKSDTTTIDVPNLLTSDFTATSHTGDTNETDLKSFTMPGSTMGTGDCLRIKTWGTTTSAGDTLTLKLKFGSATIGTTVTQGAVTDWHIEGLVANRNAANAQTVLYDMAFSSSTSIVDIEDSTTTEDTASDVIIKLTGQLVNGADSVTQNGFMIERLTGDTGEAEPTTPPNPPIEPPDFGDVRVINYPNQ